MKKNILTLIVVCAFSFGALISYAGEPLTKGPIAGWHYGDILKDGNSLYGDYRSSFFAGFFSNKQLGGTKLLQLNSALLYYQNGSNRDDNNYIRLHYLNIPVSLKVQLGPVYAFGGVNGGIKLGGESYLLGIKSDVKDINTWDAGLQAGVGVKIFIFGAEAKYNWGLVDLGDGYKTQYLQLGLLLYLGGSK
jgi:hypothetical protein